MAMVNINTLRTMLGFSLKGLGFFWSFFDKFLCGTLCNNQCSVGQNQTCSLLFLFVGIIFIVCGYALIVMKEKGRKKLKTKMKLAWKQINV